MAGPTGMARPPPMARFGTRPSARTKSSSLPPTARPPDTGQRRTASRGRSRSLALAARALVRHDDTGSGRHPQHFDQRHVVVRVPRRCSRPARHRHSPRLERQRLAHGRGRAPPVLHGRQSVLRVQRSWIGSLPRCGSDGGHVLEPLHHDALGQRDPRQVRNNSFTTYRVPTANSTPHDIVSGPDGNVWFTEKTGNKIGRLVP